MRSAIVISASFTLGMLIASVLVSIVECQGFMVRLP
jgi:hypothetical protein